jgi:hypothetical protein
LLLLAVVSSAASAYDECKARRSDVISAEQMVQQCTKTHRNHKIISTQEISNCQGLSGINQRIPEKCKWNQDLYCKTKKRAMACPEPGK